MKRAKIILSAICLFVAGTTTVNAQQKQHEFTLGAGGGISSLQYSLDKGTQTMGFGGNVGLGYTFFFHKQWGVGTGVELGFYNAKATFPQTTLVYSSVDPDGFDFEAHAKLNNYEEKQKAMLLNIPLMLQFQTDSYNKFYLAAGVKFGIPMSGTYNTTGNYTMIGHYPEFGNEFDIIDIPSEGFGTLPYDGGKKDLDLGVAISLAVQTGVKWQLNEQWALYTGVYFDYGFNDIYSGDRDQNIVAYDVNKPGYITENSIVSSTFTDKLAPLALGVNIKVAFGCGKALSERQSKAVEPSPENKALMDAADKAADKAAQAADKAAQAADRAADALEKATKAVEAQRAQATQAVNEAKAKQEASAIPSNDLKVFSEVINNYGLGSATPLTAEQKAVADKKIELLKKDSKDKVILVGYTCNTGTPESNLKLGLKRAEIVKDYMVQNGISADRITTTSRGEADPVYPNDTEDHKRLNRRVEVVAYQ